jgi:uncharacterized protein (DUF305 family)
MSSSTTPRSRGRTRAGGALFGALFLFAACASAGRTPPPATSAGGSSITADAVAAADSLRHSYTAADVAFMQGMIHHHAQALVMAGMAPTHGASGAIQVMAARIINAQKDEIALMEAWLRNNGEPVPDPSHRGHETMPGMLTSDQMADLAAARGVDWDLRFLTYMIQHHEGAVTMVEDLFGTFGAAQGDAVFKLASDIEADQTSEIDRMRTMLRQMALADEDSR